MTIVHLVKPFTPGDKPAIYCGAQILPTNWVYHTNYATCIECIRTCKVLRVLEGNPA